MHALLKRLKISLSPKKNLNPSSLYARILTRGTKEQWTVLRLTPFGALLAPESDRSEESLPHRVDTLEIWEDHDVVATFSDVLLRPEEDERWSAIFVSREKERELQRLFTHHRQFSRVRLPPRFYPHATAASPDGSDRTLHFFVRDLSIQGAQLVSRRVHSLRVESELTNFIIHFPSSGDVSAQTKVVHVGATENQEEKRFGVKFTRTDPAFQRAVTEFLNLVTDDESVCLADIVGSGIQTTDLPSIQVQPLKNLTEYTQVLSLRKCPTDELGPTYRRDLSSEILVGRCRQEVMAYARIQRATLHESSWALVDDMQFTSGLEHSERAKEFINGLVQFARDQGLQGIRVEKAKFDCGWEKFGFIAKKENVYELQIKKQKKAWPLGF